MEAQIRASMRAAMRDLLAETLAKPRLEPVDVEWLRRLCLELVQRVNALTPSRRDLHAQLAAAFDVDLVVQMAAHQAFDAADARAATEAVMGRLAMLCAPSQDARVAQLRAGDLDVGTLLVEANVLVDEIEALADAARAEARR